MLSKIAYQAKAFFHNPLRYVADNSNYMTEYYVLQAADAGKTPAEITVLLETELGLLKGGGAIRQIAEGGIAAVEFVNKHALKIVIALMILIAAYYLLAFRKVLA